MIDDKPAKANRGFFKTAYWGLTRGENALRHPFLLLIRLYWGALLCAVGVGKWMQTAGVAEYFASLGIPKPFLMAYLVASIELLGGISLILGCLTRLFSLFLTVVFCVAYATAHATALHNIFSTPSLFVQEQPFLYLYASLLVLCFGPGLFSLDYWMEKKAFGQPC